MPSMASVSVYKADGTTLVAYDAVTPSSGDKVAANWVSTSQGSAMAFRPKISMTSRWNGNKTARRIDVEGSFAQTYESSDTELTSINSVIPFSFSIALPAVCPQATIDEAVAQFCHFLNSDLPQACLKAGYAPT